jgi:hypothetical protein
MKTFTLFLFTLGVVMMTIGYMDIFIKSKKADRQIEYRFVPRDVYAEIADIKPKYNDLFEGEDVLKQRGNFTSNLV